MVDGGSGRFKSTIWSGWSDRLEVIVVGVASRMAATESATLHAGSLSNRQCGFEP